MNEQLCFDDQDGEWLADENLNQGATWMLDAVAAVDFLRRGDRSGLNIWEALEEAIRWWTAERIALVAGVADVEFSDPPDGDEDPLRPTLTRFLDATALDEPVHISVALQQALRRWGDTMSRDYNEDQPWPHPLSRRLSVMADDTTQG